MNKILIKDILNNQNIKKEEKNITNIKDELFKICSFLPNYLSNISDDLLTTFDNIIGSLCEFKNSGEDKSKKNEKNDLKTAYQICCIMEQIIYHIPKEDLKKHLKIEENPLIFNIMTQDMMNKKKTSVNSYRGHRFSLDNVAILEKWYKDHYQKPYLTKNSLEKLAKATGLNKVQIRNWVSNKRRKEKSVQVSPIIQNLLQNKTLKD